MMSVAECVALSCTSSFLGICVNSSQSQLPFTKMLTLVPGSVLSALPALSEPLISTQDYASVNLGSVTEAPTRTSSSRLPL